MTLFESRPYDAARARRRRNLIIAIVVAVVVFGVIAYQFRFWPERHQVDRFFSALCQQNFEEAYGIWMNDSNWKQHPQQYARYPFAEFMKDWGPGGEWGMVKTYKIDGAVEPSGGNASTIRVSPSGVVVVVTVNDRIGKKEHIWVEKSDKTLSFSPY